MLRVSWSITLWPEGSSGGSRRVLYHPSHSNVLFFSTIQNPNLIWRYLQFYSFVRRLWVLVSFLFMSVFKWMVWYDHRVNIKKTVIQKQSRKGSLGHPVSLSTPFDIGMISVSTFFDIDIISLPTLCNTRIISSWNIGIIS